MVIAISQVVHTSPTSPHSPRQSRHSGLPATPVGRRHLPRPRASHIGSRSLFFLFPAVPLPPFASPTAKAPTEHRRKRLTPLSGRPIPCQPHALHTYALSAMVLRIVGAQAGGMAVLTTSHMFPSPAGAWRTSDSPLSVPLHRRFCFCTAAALRNPVPQNLHRFSPACVPPSALVCDFLFFLRRCTMQETRTGSGAARFGGSSTQMNVSQGGQPRFF